MKSRLKKGDFVQVIKGEDIGKKGRIIRVIPEEGKVLVEGINFVMKHTKPKAVDKQGGIIQMEKPVSISNVMYFCMKCNKPTRLKIKILQDGSKTRYCKRCGELAEVR
jgi:large subunit ribosomal protein L24